MTAKVVCESGYSGCDRPKSVEKDGVLYQITEVLREWREPGAKHYLVRTHTGMQLKLVFYEASGDWDALEVSISP